MLVKDCLGKAIEITNSFSFTRLQGIIVAHDSDDTSIMVTTTTYHYINSNKNTIEIHNYPLTLEEAISIAKSCLSSKIIERSIWAEPNQINQTTQQIKVVKDYPHTCNLCNNAAYICPVWGKTECSNPGCPHYK